MGTFLFSDIIFGPVQSRRLGSSLGINILPLRKKFCNFNCVYCECGLNPKEGGYEMPTREEVRANLEVYFVEHKERPDAITFAGNGEPTIHPEFAAIIDDTVVLRNLYAPKAKVVVLSNATMLHKPEVFAALQKVDYNIQKLDSVLLHTIALINQPGNVRDSKELIALLKSFKGKVIIQTLFIRGEHNGATFDNTTETELKALIEAYKEIAPEYVMVYGISRDTPIDTLTKIGKEELSAIGESIEKAGIAVKVSY